MVTRRRLVVAVGVLTVAALSGCGAGQRAAVYQVRTSEDGPNAHLGQVLAANLLVRAPTTGRTLPQGGDAQITGEFVNNSDKPDTLTSVSSADAASVVLLPGRTVVPSLAVPPLGVGGLGSTIELHGLRRELHPGDYVTLTLQFVVNGHADVQVTVQSPTDVTASGAP